MSRDEIFLFFIFFILCGRELRRCELGFFSGFIG